MIIKTYMFLFSSISWKNEGGGSHTFLLDVRKGGGGSFRCIQSAAWGVGV